MSFEFRVMSHECRVSSHESRVSLALRSFSEGGSQVVLIQFFGYLELINFKYLCVTPFSPYLCVEKIKAMLNFL